MGPKNQIAFSINLVSKFLNELKRVFFFILAGKYRSKNLKPYPYS